MKFKDKNKEHKCSVKLLQETDSLYSDKLNKFISTAMSNENVLKFNNFQTQYNGVSYTKAVIGDQK